MSNNLSGSWRSQGTGECCFHLLVNRNGEWRGKTIERLRQYIYLNSPSGHENKKWSKKHSEKCCSYCLCTYRERVLADPAPHEVSNKTSSNDTLGICTQARIAWVVEMKWENPLPAMKHVCGAKAWGAAWGRAGSSQHSWGYLPAACIATCAAMW